MHAFGFKISLEKPSKTREWRKLSRVPIPERIIKARKIRAIDYYSSLAKLYLMKNKKEKALLAINVAIAYGKIACLLRNQDEKSRIDLSGALMVKRKINSDMNRPDLALRDTAKAIRLNPRIAYSD